MSEIFAAEHKKPQETVAENQHYIDGHWRDAIALATVAAIAHYIDAQTAQAFIDMGHETRAMQVPVYVGAFLTLCKTLHLGYSYLMVEHYLRKPKDGEMVWHNTR